MLWRSGKPQPIAALGFDFDGTLVDSLAAIRHAAHRAAAAVGVSVPDDRVGALSALSLDDYNQVLDFASAAQFACFKVEFRSVFDRESFRHVEPFDDAREVLAEAMARLGPRAVFVLTNRRHESAVQIAAHLGWPPIGGGIHSTSAAVASDGNRKTPILRTLAARYPQPDRVAYVGDAATDLDAARDAGIVPVLYQRPDARPDAWRDEPGTAAAVLSNLRDALNLIGLQTGDTTHAPSPWK